MKALVKAKAEQGIWLEDVPQPKVGPNDVLIKISKTAICGTDIHIYNWDGWAQKNVPVPMVVGHEYSGVIAEVGSNVTEVQVGQRVSGEGHIVGHKSRNARAGKFHLDPETKGVGVNLPGAFAEYLVLPAFNVVALPDSVPDEIGAILDPLGNAVHTALSYDLVGEDVLITGAGAIGIMAAAVARHVGARNVVITDVNPFRLQLASKVADVRTVNVQEEDLRSVMTELHIVEGFDVGLEMSGTKAGFDEMTDRLMMGGRMALLGLPSAPFETDWSKIILKALKLKGVYGREMFETWYKMLAMLESGLDITPVITHQFAARDYQQAFDAMRSGLSGKVVLDWAAV
ncbi:L-threonine 3-dehydrogenase [Kordiimonas pumila]|uniref:L-threonine 3-dehydrogenase n=1 Tax=Kordiimonas pumila TaxID=2161677 RepID=A0ABV7D1S9_9PROT|nr:L-threonine 3-dehydrogenase [Kordiimonas pumila]